MAAIIHYTVFLVELVRKFVVQDILEERACEQNAGLVVQLGDVGSGKISGSAEAFAIARGYLEGFGCQYSTILGMC
jgi:hypothetical protein